MRIRKTVVSTTFLLALCAAVAAPGVHAMDINKGSFVVDFSIGYGPKCWSAVPAVFAVKYFVADGVAVEVFAPAVLLALLAVRPGPVERSSKQGVASPPARFGPPPFGAEVNYYPPAVREYGYLSFGLSRTESTLWALNADVGVNTNGLYSVKTESELDRGLEAYAESGVALMLGRLPLDNGTERDASQRLLPDFSKRLLPNIEMGMRYGGPVR